MNAPSTDAAAMAAPEPNPDPELMGPIELVCTAAWLLPWVAVRLLGYALALMIDAVATLINFMVGLLCAEIRAGGGVVLCPLVMKTIDSGMGFLINCVWLIACWSVFLLMVFWVGTTVFHAVGFAAPQLLVKVADYMAGASCSR